MNLYLRNAFFVFLAFQICSCNFAPDHNYRYHEGLIRFLNERTSIEVDKLIEEKLLFVDLSCEECVLSKLDFLSARSDHFSIKVYIMGDTTRSVLVKEFKSIIIGYDLESKYHFYETGISMPLLIDIQNGVIKESFIVNDFNQSEIFSYLNPSKQE
jgi:hypothetical protein